ncbi:hypothetical protein FB45DRAFT_1013736 [Roridomyces roridus]|uniref:Uncharacterized protein n=1 Tax=Roridomyces roridus TaxID=1738132 RepID=A0AAD7F650_9AGAR|nr:hypothetical protein FB45DRAFT_1013736 [Roridomyces roridus]
MERKRGPRGRAAPPAPGTPGADGVYTLPVASPGACVGLCTETVYGQKRRGRCGVGGGSGWKSGGLDELRNSDGCRIMDAKHKDGSFLTPVVPITFILRFGTRLCLIQTSNGFLGTCPSHLRSPDVARHGLLAWNETKRTGGEAIQAGGETIQTGSITQIGGVHPLPHSPLQDESRERGNILQTPFRPPSLCYEVFDARKLPFALVGSWMCDSESVEAFVRGENANLQGDTIVRESRRSAHGDSFAILRLFRDPGIYLEHLKIILKWFEKGVG